MTFNRDTFSQLSQWENYFYTAIHLDYARYPGRDALMHILAAYNEATGENRRNNVSCGRCNLRLLRDCGRIYFADKAEMEAQSKAAKTKTKKSRSNAV